MRNPSSSTAAAEEIAKMTRRSNNNNNNSSNSKSKTTPCCSKVGLKRGPWTPEEDEILSNYINKEGEGKWRTLPKRAGLLRCGKSCRLRWMNYLRPCVKRGQIAPDEEDLILRLHRLLGNRWSLIAGRIPGRTDNEIKNYWNTHLSKKLISRGIDPRTHKPLNLNDNNTPDHDAAKASSSQTNQPPPNPNPNYNHIASPATIEIAPNASIQNHGYVSTINDIDQYQTRSMLIGHENLPISNGGPVIGLRNVNHGDFSNKEDDDIDYGTGTDDVFSSFLNSLIDEDAFVSSQQQLVVQQQLNGIATIGLDPLISTMSMPMTTFGHGPSGWESSFISSTSNQIDQPKKMNDQIKEV